MSLVNPDLCLLWGYPSDLGGTVPSRLSLGKVAKASSLELQDPIRLLALGRAGGRLGI